MTVAKEELIELYQHSKVATIDDIPLLYEELYSVFKKLRPEYNDVRILRSALRTLKIIMRDIADDSVSYFTCSLQTLVSDDILYWILDNRNDAYTEIKKGEYSDV